VVSFVVVLVIVNVVRSAVVPGGFHFPLNLSIGVLAVVVGWAAGSSRADLGLDPGHGWAGVRLGLAAMGVVAAVTILAALVSPWVPAIGEAFTEAGTDISLGELLLGVLLVIPLGTVVMEELVFRGLVLGTLLRTTSSVRAVIVSSSLFGLWHVYPAFHGADDLTPLRIGIVVVGTFVATTIAGVVFAWLRLRSQSLVAAILAHLGTNTIPLTAAWLLS
jgi:uncharacterized protein